MEDIYLKLSGKDIYKAVKQFITTSLNITKEDIQNEIKEKAEIIAWNAIKDFRIGNAMESAIEDKVTEIVQTAVKNAAGGSGWGTKYDIERFVEKIVRAEVNQYLENKIKNAISISLNGVNNNDETVETT